MKNLNICIAGLGNVGSAVVSVIEKNSQYIKNKSNLTINIIALLISLGSVIFIGVKSHNEIKKRMQSYEPESIL